MERIWLKNWPEDMPRDIVYPNGEIPIHEYLKINAREVPDHIAIVFYGTKITYKELDESSNRFANYLIAKGIKKGDRVGIYLGNCPQYIIAHFGIQKIGGIVCPINPMFKEMELQYQINDAGMSLIVTSDFQCFHINGIIDKLPTVKSIVCTNFNEYLPENPTLPILEYMKIKPIPVENADKFCEIMKNESSAEINIKVNMDDLALFEYTGGSTGLPKGAMHSHRSHLFKPLAFLYVRSLNQNSIEITPMPYFHIAGMGIMLGNVLAKSTNVCLAQFEPITTLMAIEKYKATHIYTAVPMNLQMMNHPEQNKFDLSTLKLNLTTSFVVSLNEKIAKRWEQLTNGCMLIEAAYGLSETHTADTFMPKNNNKYNSVGIPTYCTDIKILDINDNNKEVPIGEQGEIAVKTPGLMVGYWNKPEETEKAFKDGYLLTGDIGKFDEDGYLYWLGRLKEMIKVSGHSVFPEEVEALMNQHPDIIESAVIPEKDDKKGEVVKAFVVIKPDRKGLIKEQELIDWAKENMTPHKAPVYIKFRDELPKSGVKLLRRILREEEEAK